MAWRNPFRRAPEARAVVDVPWNVGPSTTRVDVTRAMSLAPMYSAIRIIAQDVSTLPLKSYRKVDGERVPMRGLPVLFQHLVDDGDLTPWLFRLVTSLAARGNAYGLVTQRDGFGFPTVISWLNPEDVSCNDDANAAPDWRWRFRTVPTEDIVHIPWFVLPGKRLGLSPIESFATMLNVGIHAQDYADGWFEAGGVPPGTFQNTALEVDQDVAVAAKQRLVAAIRSRQPLVYGKDWTYTPISISPKDAQLVEAQGLTANMIAGIYGVRPEKIGGDAGSSLTYATVEQSQLEYTTSTLRFWAELLEGHFFGLLPERQYVKFNLDALVRSDLKTRWEVHAIAAGMGAKNIDEIRKLEDLEPLPAGQGKEYKAISAAPVAADDTPTGDDNVTPIRRPS